VRPCPHGKPIAECREYWRSHRQYCEARSSGDIGTLDRLCAEAVAWPTQATMWSVARRLRRALTVGR